MLEHCGMQPVNLLAGVVDAPCVGVINGEQVDLIHRLTQVVDGLPQFAKGTFNLGGIGRSQRPAGQRSHALSGAHGVPAAAAGCGTDERSSLSRAVMRSQHMVAS